MTIICGTGSRQFAKLLPSEREKVVDGIKKVLVRQSAKTVISGMAEGFDEFLILAAKSLGLPYNLYIPNKGYVDWYWQNHSVTGFSRRVEALKYMEGAAKIVYCCSSIYVDGVHSNFWRNIEMLQDAQEIVTGKFDHLPSRGTDHCIREANKLRKPVHDIGNWRNS